MTFGEMLIMLMEERGMTPTELAHKSGVGKTTISELINGRTKEPTFSKAKALADGLGVTLEDFARILESE